MSLYPKFKLQAYKKDMIWTVDVAVMESKNRRKPRGTLNFNDEEWEEFRSKLESGSSGTWDVICEEYEESEPSVARVYNEHIPGNREVKSWDCPNYGAIATWVGQFGAETFNLSYAEAKIVIKELKRVLKNRKSGR